MQLFARSVRTMLRPDGLLVVLTDSDTRVALVAHNSQYANPRPDDPLVQVISTEGPRVLPHVTRRALEALGVSVDYPVRSWVGAPIIAVGRTLGVVSAIANTPGQFTEGHVHLLSAANAQLGMALENARLLKLIAGGKGEWEQTVDAIGQAFCVVAPDGTIRRANRAFSVIAHIPVTAVAGRPWISVLPEDWADPVSRALAAAGNHSQYELRSGARVFTVSALALAEPRGTAVLVFEDQSAKRRLQDQLIQSEKMSAIGQLIAGVAHDLNNPLASVVGFADYLVEEGNPPDSMRHALEAIRHEAERAAAIVRSLLNFARKQEGKRRAQPIAPILEATLTLLRNQLMASKVEAELKVDPDLADVDVDANQIQQVFVNLINNAAQTMRSSGIGERVLIHATGWLDGVAVTVADDGPGVPPEVADRIFEPFFTTKPEGEGTGLGLSICQGIVREHGGRITYAPGAEGGAVFRVELPAGVPAHITQETAIPDTGELRILVVDDEPHILHYMRATLEAWGHAVEVASDGATGLARATTQPFDVVITDLRMPDPGGRELFEALHRDHPSVAERVIFATGDTVGGDTLAFLESSGRPYLRKPFTLAELRSALGKAVGPSDDTRT
ncbi:MAG: response regulator [Gemmatimonadota bacterium]|nr:MAG: response regulator [Gemmatimonadota bacterium]